MGKQIKNLENYFAQQIIKSINAKVQKTIPFEIEFGISENFLFYFQKTIWLV